MKDRIFTQDIGKQFEFDAQVASVFDDMLERSIPHYKEVLGLIVDFCVMNLISNADCLQDSTQVNKKNKADSAKNTTINAFNSTIINNPLVYDLGSSTGNTLLALALALPSSTRFVGIDNSQAMIDKASLKAKAYNAHNINFVCADLLEYEFAPCNIVIANYILQFIRPLQRPSLLQKIYDALGEGGVFILSEKMTSHHRILDKQMIERYLRYKTEQGYTQSEISKKREALENVLVPFSLEENIALLKEVGFSGIEVLFKWVNFGTIIAKKA